MSQIILTQRIAPDSPSYGKITIFLNIADGLLYYKDSIGTVHQLSALSDTDDLIEGSTNKYFTEGRVLATIASGLTGTSGVPAGTDSILTILGKILKGFYTDHSGAGGAIHASATTSVAGFLSAIDKSTIDALNNAATLIFDTDGTLAANSDARLPTQKAVKTAIANAVIGLLNLKGGTDCSTNPNYPSGVLGDAYYVTVAGKIGGASGTSVDVGDVYFANAVNAGGTEASVGTGWSHLEHNLIGALLAANNLSELSSATTALTNLGLTANGKSLVTAVNYAAMLSLLGIVTIGTSGSASDLSSGTVPAARMPALTGDITTSVGTVATTLATVNSNVGSFGDSTHFTNFTVNAKGLITAASQVAVPAAAPGGSNTYVQFNDSSAFGGDSGLTFDKTNKALSIGGATVTANAPPITVLQTWNNASITFQALLVNITNTTSDARSKVFDLQVGSASIVSVIKNGWVNLAAGVNASGIPTQAGMLGNPGSNGGVAFTANANNTIWIAGPDVRTTSVGMFAWSGDSTNAVSARVLAIEQTDSSTLGINNGTLTSGAGAFRDIKARNVIATNLVKLAPFTVATLPSAAASAGSEAYVTDALTAPIYNATATAGGSTKAKVWSDGSSWLYA